MGLVSLQAPYFGSDWCGYIGSMYGPSKLSRGKKILGTPDMARHWAIFVLIYWLLGVSFRDQHLSGPQRTPGPGELKQHSSFCRERTVSHSADYEVQTLRGQRGLSSLTSLSFCISLPGEEHGLPLLTQDSNSKARRGILRRAVFSEDQRKALERMFQKQKYISKTDRRKLAVSLGLKESQVPTRRKTPPIPGFSMVQLVLWHECLVPGVALCPRVFSSVCSEFSVGGDTQDKSCVETTDPHAEGKAEPQSSLFWNEGKRRGCNIWFSSPVLVCVCEFVCAHVCTCGCMCVIFIPRETD